MNFLKSLPDPPYVIITTAYREYAIEGYDLDVIDFLLKPISFERFLKAINRYCNRSNPFHKNSAGQPQSQSQSAESRNVFIQDGKNIYKIPYDDLLYLEGFGEYVKVITVSKTHLVRDSLTDFEQKLPSDHFLRIHKSYIVNLNKITGYSSVHVMLTKIELPIGRIFREKVVNILKKGSSR